MDEFRQFLQEYKWRVIGIAGGILFGGADIHHRLLAYSAVDRHYSLVLFRRMHTG